MIRRLWALQLVFLAVALPSLQAQAKRSASAEDLIAETSAMVIRVDVRGLSQSVHYPRLRAMLDANEEIRSMLSSLTAAGVELERDVRKVVLAISDMQNSDGLILFVEGTGLYPRLRKVAEKENKLIARRHRGVEYVLVSEKDDGQTGLASVAGVVVLGSEDAIKTSIDQLSDHSTALRRGPRLGALHGKLVRHHISLLVRASGGAPMGLPATLDGVTHIGIGATLNRSMAVQLLVLHKDVASLSKTSAMMGMLKSMAANDAGLKAMGLAGALKGQRLSQSGELLRADYVVGETDLATLAAALKGASN
jgi:hypothetical protein